MTSSRPESSSSSRASFGRGDFSILRSSSATRSAEITGGLSLVFMARIAGIRSGAGSRRRDATGAARHARRRRRRGCGGVEGGGGAGGAARRGRAWRAGRGGGGGGGGGGDRARGGLPGVAERGTGGGAGCEHE